MKQFKEPLGFDWDEGNRGKNLKKHSVTDEECEEIFFDPRKAVTDDILHSSEVEQRYILLGKTKRNRLLYAAFTIRGGKVRIISCRDTNKKEVKLYEKAN